MTTENRIALVTGANRGIGFEICRQLGELGHTVILTSRNVKAGKEAAQSLRDEGLDIIHYQLDVSNDDHVNSILRWVEVKFGRLDILINNAAIYPDEGRRILNIERDTLVQTLEVNTVGPWMMCQAFIPLMKKTGYGRVVNISSSMGSIQNMGGRTGAYRVSKAALNALTRVIAREVRDKNIKINTMDPGWVHTDMGGSNAPRTPEQGADTAVWLATLLENGPTNGFFRDRRPTQW